MNEIVGVVSLFVMAAAGAAIVLLIVRWFTLEQEFRRRIKEIEDEKTK